jgi:NAD(P)-dependent dehydrogenase (short-subunit alcohol dehydrogenase family)
VVLRKNTALVTGASRGIGKAIAIELAKAGYDIAVAARTVAEGDAARDHSVSIHRKNDKALPGSLEETADQIRSVGRDVLVLQMDLTDLAMTEAAVQRLLDEWGGAEVVVNNGRHIGPGLMDTILDTGIDEYPKFLTAHGVAPIRIVQMTLPPMLEAGAGTFVTISSGSGYDWYPLNPPGQAGVGLGYRIGKAAGHTLVGSILAEYGGQGIRAFNVNPGAVMTERNEADISGTGGFDLSMFAPPAAVGAAVAWLVTSPEADALQRTNIDAQDIALDRGLHPDWRKPADS